MVVDLAVLWIVGTLTAVPAVAWCAHDMHRIPGPVWFWSGYHRGPWHWALGVGLAFGGYAAIITALVWSRSAERRDLRAEAGDFLAHAREARHARHH